MRKRIVYFIYIFALLLFASCQSQEEDSSTKAKPNVLLILTDDQGWGDFGFHGNDSISTPHLDAFAQQAVRFTNFHVSPVCAPTRASLLTGRYHQRTGTSWVTHRKEVMRSQEYTLAELFADNGYRTALFGKWHNGEQYPNDPNGQGFEEFVGFKAGHWNNYFNTKLDSNQTQIESNGGYIIDDLTNRAIDYIQKEEAPPFFCYLSINTPHSPFQVPDVYFDKYKAMGLTDKNACVHGMVENIDDNFGKIVAALDKMEELDNTIILYLTDNGPNGNRYNGNMRGRKGSVYEGGTRVPLWLSWPAALEGDRDIADLSGHIDVLPTLIGLLGLEKKGDLSLDGLNFGPVLKGEEASLGDRVFYTQFNSGKEQLYPGAINTGQYKLVMNRQNQAELYDLQQDPGESRDLKESLPSIAEELSQQYINAFKEMKPTSYQRPPIPLGYPQSPEVHLPAPEASLTGEAAFKGGFGWANDYIIDWSEKGDAATWLLEVVEPGSYTIEMLYNADQDIEAGIFGFHLNDEVIAGDFALSAYDGSDFENDLDRVKRGEVYEYNWRRVEVGQIALEEGMQELTIQLQEEKKSRFKLKGLVLSKM